MGPTICIIYIVTIGCYDLDLRNWNQGNWRSSTIEQSKLCGGKKTQMGPKESKDASDINY